uniref:Uncharacterized protein n=1 Tax=Meloidogyne javanica TaxID=6303 RepID=A0A915N7K3_MELJA
MLSKFRPKLVVLLILFLVIKCKGSSRYGEIELGGYTDEIEVVGEEGIEEAPIYESMITEKNKHNGIYNKEDVKKMIKDLEEHVEKGGSKEKDYVSPFMIEEPEASSSDLKPRGREKARSLSFRERAKTIADMPIFERSATTTVGRKKGETIHLGKQ